jgi:Copper amine oxidase N-terminal domain.
MKQTKRFCSALLALLLLFTMNAFSAIAGNTTVTIDGQTIIWGTAEPYSDNGTIMVPLQRMTELFNGTYFRLTEINGGSGKAIVNMNNKQLVISLDSKIFSATDVVEENGYNNFVNSKDYTLAKPVSLVNNKVYFPLDVFCNVFGFELKQTATATDLVTVGDSNQISLNQIRSLYNNERYDDCITACDIQLAKGKIIMESYYLKTNSYYSQKKYQEAYDTAIENLKFCPNDTYALYNAASSASLLKNVDLAMKHLETILKLDVKYKGKIISDHDFDNVRTDARYVKLIDGITVFVGGETLTFDVEPVIQDGRTMVPLRKIFEALGAEVSYDDASKTVTAKKGTTTLVLPIGSKTAKLNGVEKSLDVPAKLTDGRTLVPLRFVGEALDAKVDWDGTNRIVNILTKAPEGTSNYTTTKPILDASIAVSVVDGYEIEPNHLKGTEGMSFLIFKDKKGFDAFQSLKNADRATYVADTVYQNYGLVQGRETVYAKVVFDGKVYYEGNFVYQQKDSPMTLTYFENGKPYTIVKQYKTTFDYFDFYLLPPEAQTTSKIDEIPPELSKIAPDAKLFVKG